MYMFQVLIVTAIRASQHLFILNTYKHFLPHK